MRLPDKISGGRQAFVLLTSVIRAHLAEELFQGRRVEAFSQFRLTRDPNSRSTRRRSRTFARRCVQARRRATRQAIRSEVCQHHPPELSSSLRQFGTCRPPCVPGQRPGQPGRMKLIDDAADVLAFRFSRAWPWSAGWAIVSIVLASAPGRRCCIIRSFAGAGGQFLREGGQRPGRFCGSSRRSTVRQRVAADGPADRGGAAARGPASSSSRHADEANINWAERLEAIGAQVVYGIVR